MSPIDDRGGSLTASPQILNQKKKINTESQKMNQSHRWSRPCQRNQTPILLPIQSKSAKENETPAKPKTDSQSDKGVYLKKKKKISNTQTKTKPRNPSKPNPETHGHVAATPQLVIARPSLQIGDHRSEIALCLCLCSGARCSPSGPPSGPPSRYFSLFLSFSLTEMKKIK